MEKFNIKGNVMILVTTMIWGAAFAAQRIGMENVGPFTFISIRFLIGGCVTMAAAPLFALSNASRSGRAAPSLRSGRFAVFARADKTYISFGNLFNKGTLKAGVICGAVLFAASALQQVGIQYTTVGKAGFLTSLYVLFVPVLGLFLGRRPRMPVWFGMALAVLGTYFLSVTEGFYLNPGDMFVLACALFFAFHIMAIDRFVRDADGIALSSIQFFTVAAVAAVFMFILEEPRLPDILDASLPILYAGLLSSGVAYTLQAKAQKITAPAVAAILFSMEAVFAALAGYAVLGESFTARELLGCGLVLAAVIVSQLKRPEARG